MASLLTQTVRNFEWVVVDGGSTDETSDVMLTAHGLNVSWSTGPDRGIADAWNKGIERASGFRILILNAGDTYDPKALEAYTASLDKDQITCAHARVVDSNERDVRIFKAEPAKLYRGMHLPHNWCCVPVDFYREFGGYRPLRFGMDFDWFHRVYRSRGSRVFHVIDRVLGNYHLGGLSDQHYLESFEFNERILIEHGSSRIFARGCRLAYSSKHAIQRVVVSLRGPRRRGLLGERG